MTRDEALRRLRAAEPALRRQGVVQAWLFGSVARDSATEASDVDVAVRLTETTLMDLVTLGSIRADLMDALECEVDVVPRHLIAADPKFDAGFERDAVQVL
jgi:predicted nucleotidyltransferase